MCGMRCQLLFVFFVNACLSFWQFDGCNVLLFVDWWIFDGFGRFLCQRLWHASCVRFHRSSIAEAYMRGFICHVCCAVFVSSHKRIKPISSFLFFHVFGEDCRSAATFIVWWRGEWGVEVGLKDAKSIEIAVKIGELEDDFEDTNKDFEEIRKFLAGLKVNCEIRKSVALWSKSNCQIRIASCFACLLWAWWYPQAAASVGVTYAHTRVSVVLVLLMNEYSGRCWYAFDSVYAWMCAYVFCLVLCSVCVQCVAAYLCDCLSYSTILLWVASMCGSLIELGLSGVVCM